MRKHPVSMFNKDCIVCATVHAGVALTFVVTTSVIVTVTVCAAIVHAAFVVSV